MLSDLDEHGGDGWFSTVALDLLMAEYNGRTFEQVFVCDPNKPYYGFGSFEDFFTRRYRSPEIDRPTGPIDDLSLISAPCETTSYAYQTNIQLVDELFIKNQKYSLIHLLGNDPNTKEFIGGSVLQGVLRMTEYHRMLKHPAPYTLHSHPLTPVNPFPTPTRLRGSPIPPLASFSL